MLVTDDGVCPAQTGAACVNAADEKEASVAVFGRRGMGSVGRAVCSAVGLGSVSEYAIAHSNVPVVVCPHRRG